MMSRPLIPAEEALSMLGRAVFLDARAGPDADSAYATAHLPGALKLDLETDLSKPADPTSGGRHPLPDLEDWLSRLGRWGIGPSTPVVLYDAGNGGMAAARAWWMLHALGHEPLAVVDGGWRALQSAGAAVEQGRVELEGVDAYPRTLSRWPSVDADFVECVREDPSWRLIDARAPARYEGLSEPLDPVAGHIPGARNLYWQTQLASNEAFQSTETLQDRFAQLLGDTPADRVVCYCGSGVTACHLLLALEACGLRGARLYVGSWSEWCRQDRARAVL